MKRITLIASVLFFAFSANAQQKIETPVATTQTQPKDVNKSLEFTNAEYNFGKIPFGKPAEYELSFKNISADTVTLERVQVSCGCTTPKYTQGEKIAPGKSAKIILGFNGNSDGHFTKYVTLFFNDSMSKQVIFRGETFKTPESSAPANGGVQKMKNGIN
ncbi:MAG: DUF1573 domain-containing protein [Chitinophagales bacterium]|nr:DUF1573 domain-containing protein [Chitinophagaceae bacterium]MCZ2298888.1 DUF1573 domain-containing protein [Chitinophagales bacterium]